MDFSLKLTRMVTVNSQQSTVNLIQNYLAIFLNFQRFCISAQLSCRAETDLQHSRHRGCLGANQQQSAVWALISEGDWHLDAFEQNFRLFAQSARRGDAYDLIIDDSVGGIHQFNYYHAFARRNSRTRHWEAGRRVCGC